MLLRGWKPPLTPLAFASASLLEGEAAYMVQCSAEAATAQPLYSKKILMVLSAS